MMKKIAIALGALFALILIAIVVIPFVVDVDKYRPRIVEEANRRINGRLELGKLSLSLWGQVRIQIASLSLADSRGQSVLSVQDAYFHVPFSSLLSGSPALTLKMQSPVITLVKDKSGKLNVMSLMKDGKSARNHLSPADRLPSSTTAMAAEGGTAMELPAMARRARIGIELRQAIVNYRDELSGLKTQIKDLNLTVRDLSLNRPTEIELWANLDTQMSSGGKTTLTVQGPVRITATASPMMQDSKLSQIGLVALAKFEDIDITVPGVFHKKKGVPASIDLDITASEQLAKINKLKAQFFNAIVQAQGQITQVSTAPAVNLDVESGSIDLKPWSELLPALQSAELGGHVTLKAHAEGPSSQLSYRANLGVVGLTAKAPGLKAQPRIDGDVRVSTDQIENFVFTLKAPGNDLKLNGKLVSFTQPKLQAEISSGGLDLDQLMEFKAPAAPVKAEPQKTESSSLLGFPTPAFAADPAAPSYDAMLASLRQNKILQAAQATVGINIRALKAQGIKISDILGRLVLKNLVATLDQFSMKLWGGSTKANLLFNLGAAPLATYKFSAQVENLDLSQSVSSQVQMLKNTMYGKAFMNASGEGAGLDPNILMDRIKVRGNFKVKDAVFTSIDVSKMATEALNKGIQKVGEKIPAAKGKEIKSLPNRSSKYAEVSSDFTVSDGKFSAPNFATKAEPNQGIDLKGETVVGLKDYSLKTRWEVIDTYNLTKAKDISIDQAGVKVEHILAEGSGPVRFPVSAGCTLSQPCYSYTEVPEFLAKVALGNAGKALQGRAKSEAKKQVESVIEKSGLPEQFKGLGKKLFH